MDYWLALTANSLKIRPPVLVSITAVFYQFVPGIIARGETAVNHFYESTEKTRFLAWFYASYSLLLGDLAAILLFVFLGQLDHNTTDPNNLIRGLFRAAFPFLITWIIVAFLAGAYPAAGNMTVYTLLLRGLNAWLIAAPLGLLLRTFLLGRSGIPSTFMLLTLVVGAALILIWRLLFGLVWQYRTKQQGSTDDTGL